MSTVLFLLILFLHTRNKHHQSIKQKSVQTHLIQSVNSKLQPQILSSKQGGLELKTSKMWQRFELANSSLSVKMWALMLNGGTFTLNSEILLTGW